MDLDTAVESLTMEPRHLDSCCCGVSLRLLEILLARFPADPSLVLSVRKGPRLRCGWLLPPHRVDPSFAFAAADSSQIGSGSGLLEELLYRKSNGKLNIYGVEVPSCTNKYLPGHRMLQVPDVRAVATTHARRAESLMFVYPREKSLIAKYIHQSCVGGGGICSQLVVISTHSEYAEIADIIAASFSSVEIVVPSGLPEYEVLAIASTPTTTPHM